MEYKSTIEVVLKLTERCNIDCTYCYVFNKGDESYKDHPIYFTKEKAEDLSAFLSDAVKKEGIERIYFDFHGGEPLLIKKARFIEVCNILRDNLSKVCKEIHFNIQTNGMLVNREWIEILREFRFNVGVSLDGAKEINDIDRIDHNGNGTHSRVINGLNLLKKARDEGLIGGIGILAVINPRNSIIDNYRHFIHELGITTADFLLPIDYHDSFDRSFEENYGSYLCEAFDEWIKDNDPILNVRIFSGTMNALKNGRVETQNAFEIRKNKHYIFTVASNGDIGPDDSLRTSHLNLFDKYNIVTTTFTEYINSEEIKAIEKAENTIPDDCIECCWKNVCRGGATNGRLINRFSVEKGFNNKSIVCDGLKDLYSHVAAYLLKTGLGFEKLTENLIYDNDNFLEYKQSCYFSEITKSSKFQKLHITTL